MRVAITGASGFLGQALSHALKSAGHAPVAVRRDASGELRWCTAQGFDPPEALSGYDAVVHLAGENIAGGRWSDARKRSIRGSRVDGTRRVADALRIADPRPTVFVSMSAVGYYGACGSAALDEASGPGEGFLAEVCKAWEAEAKATETLEDLRVVRLRLGTVLGDGGALAKMLPAFKLGVGGRLGAGEQYMSWIHLDDAVRAILHVLSHEECSGPFNLTAPKPATNAVFTAALGKALHRPAFLRVPGVALRIAFGEMANHLLLSGQRVLPKRLLETGFEFQHPELGAALSAALR
ncbi:MAG: TIGR01777 family oxidoreductase [Nannocystaceae bacterium]|nr:TIGR01777 family oxidoreductase [Nannocystaceae bacterium]